MSSPIRLLLRFALTVALVAFIARAWPEYLVLTGGWPALVAVGALLTLLNMFLRPFLHIITLPFKLLFTLFTVIGVNIAFLFVAQGVARLFDPAIASMTVQGGMSGWLSIAVVLGLGNWAMAKVL